MPIGVPEQAADMLFLRLKRLIPLLIGILVIYVFRLWYLQIYMGSHFKARSMKYRIRHERILANRGLIMDRNGTVIVENRPFFELLVVPEDCQDLDELIKRLVQICPEWAENLQARFQLLRRAPVFKPFKLLSDVPFSLVVQLEARRSELRGILISYEAKRFYPYGDAAAHLIGFMGKITPKEWQSLQNDTAQRYRKNDFIGKSGIEKLYESSLTGTPRTIMYEADVYGRRIEILTPVNERNPIPGQDVFLTLDLKLQRFIENILQNHIGAVVAMDPRNGDILAMVNKPSFDPNLFSVGISIEDWKKLSDDPDHPMLNRCIQAAYPPGSIFKIITAAAGMKKGIITPKSTYNCLGSVKIFNEWRDCWKRAGHGTMNIHEAIVNSCNVFMFNIASQLGIDILAEMGREFGLGKRTGIMLPHEDSGLIPTPAWKKKYLNQPWWDGETLSVAIGQGSLLTTPLQLVRLMSAIAHDGLVLKPQLIKEVGGMTVKKTEIIGKIDIKPEILSIIQNGLRGVVNEKGGTARNARIDSITIAGKTGTSQVVTKEVSSKYGKNIPKKYKDHNWFVCYAPYENPQIALAVFIEHGGKKGSSEKLKFSREIIDYYLKEVSPVSPIEETAITAASSLKTRQGAISNDGAHRSPVYYEF